MATIPTRIFSFLGTTIQGDLGGLTTYVNKRGKQVWFPRASPLNPPSAEQQQMRSWLSLCAQTWRAMSQEQRDGWNSISAGARLRFTGYNLFVWYQRTRDATSVRILARQAGTTSPV